MVNRDGKCTSRFSCLVEKVARDIRMPPEVYSGFQEVIFKKLEFDLLVASEVLDKFDLSNIDMVYNTSQISDQLPEHFFYEEPSINEEKVNLDGFMPNIVINIYDEKEF